MTNREIAVVIWSTLFLVWGIYLSRRNGIFKSLADVLKSFFGILKLPISQWILITNAIIVVIMFGCLRDKIELSYWYIKDYFLIFLFAIFPTVLLLKEYSIIEIVKDKWRDLFGLLSVFLFITNTYTFSLYLELVLVFLLIILSLFSAIAEVKEEFTLIGKLFRFLLSVLGLILLFGALNSFIRHIGDVGTLNFWLSYGLELLIFVINIPILYIVEKMVVIEKMVVHSDYQNTLLTFVRYYFHYYVRKIKFRKRLLKNTPLKVQVEKYIFGYPKITIYVEGENLKEEDVLSLIAEMIINGHKTTRPSRKIDKFPVYIEIVDKNNETLALWTEDFLSRNSRFYNPFMNKKTKVIYPSVLMLE